MNVIISFKPRYLFSDFSSPTLLGLSGHLIPVIIIPSTTTEAAGMPKSARMSLARLIIIAIVLQGKCVVQLRCWIELSMEMELSAFTPVALTVYD